MGLSLNIRNRYRALNLTIKSSIWFTICNVFLKGINFITIPIFTRLLSSQEYGVLSVFMSYEQIILTLTTWETALSAYQKGIFKYKNEIKLFTKSTLILSNIVTIAFFIVVFAFFPLFSTFTGFNISNTVLLFFYMMLQPAYSCWLVLKRTENEYKKASIMSLLLGIISTVVPLAAILIVDKSANTKFNFTIIGSLILFLWFYYFGIRQGGVFDNKDRIREHWRFIIVYQIPIVAHALSFTVLSQADRIMIEKIVGSSQAAFYSVAYGVAMVISIIQNSINLALVPWRFEQLEKKNYEIIKKTTAPILVGVGTIITAFIFVAPECFRLLFSEEYYEAIWCIPPVSLSVFFMFLYSLFVWIENFYEKTKYVAIVSVACAFLNILLNYLLIRPLGYIACAYTTLVSYIVFCFGHYCFMKKTLKECKVYETIYDIKSCVLISIILIICSIVATATYSYWMIRYTIVIVTLVVLVTKRKKIKYFIAGFKKKQNKA